MGIGDKPLVDLAALARLMREHRLLDVTMGDVRMQMSPTAFQSAPQAAAPVPEGPKDVMMPSDEELQFASSGLEEAEEDEEDTVLAANPFKRAGGA